MDGEMELKGNYCQCQCWVELVKVEQYSLGL